MIWKAVTDLRHIEADLIRQGVHALKDQVNQARKAELYEASTEVGRLEHCLSSMVA
jgi:hypothetical protein